VQTETLMLERVYSVPPERVFAAWTEIATLQRWFGCAPDMLWNVHSWDVRRGGAIDVSLDFPDGPFRMTGAFLDVEPPHHLRYRWGPDETVEVTIEPHADGSALRLVHTFVPNGDARAILTGGWTHSLAALGETAGSSACAEAS
jgi:uncharacterized protein YndB with AHSA1/START domain